MYKRSFLENLTPEQRGALIGSMVGAGGLGLTTALASKKNKMRNALLAALAGGAGGAGLGYLAPGLMGGAEAAKKPEGGEAPPDVKVGPRDALPGERELAEGIGARDSALSGIKNTINQTNKRLADERTTRGAFADASKSDISGLTGAPKSNAPALSALLPSAPGIGAAAPTAAVTAPNATDMDRLTSYETNTDPLGGLTGNISRLTGVNPETPSGLGLPLTALLGTAGVAGAIGGKYKGMADKAQAAAEAAKTVTPFKEVQQPAAPAAARGKNVAETPEAAKMRRESDAGHEKALKRDNMVPQRDSEGRVVGYGPRFPQYITGGKPQPKPGEGLPKEVGGAGFGNNVPMDDVQKNILGQMGVRVPGLGGR